MVWLKFQDLLVEVALRDLTYSNLVVGVWEHRSFKDKLLGEVHFNKFQFWKSMVEDPHKMVKEWYPLVAPQSITPAHMTGTL